MKKTFLIILALALTVATIATTVAFVFAADAAAANTLGATLNEVELDGVLTVTKGTAHLYNPDNGDVTVQGTPFSAEFLMDKELGDMVIGAAWSQTKGELYIAITGEGLVEAEIDFGGKTYTADLAGGSIDNDGKIAVNEDLSVAEIALPIEGIDLYEGDRCLTTDLSITVTNVGGDENFSGYVAFTKYAAGMVNNKTLNGVAGSIASVGMGENQVVTLSDTNASAANARQYFVFNGLVNSTSCVTWKMDLCIEAMPEVDPVIDGPDLFGTTAAARIWMAFHHRKAENWYGNIYNTADGLVFAVQCNDGKSDATMELIALGKDVGETFTFEVEWNEDRSLNVYVDDVKVGDVENALNVAPQLGSAPGVLQFNIQRNSNLDSDESMIVHYSNISLCEAVADYSEEALRAWAEGEEVPTQTTSIPTETTAVPTETTAAPTETTAAPKETTADTTAETSADVVVDNTTAADTTGTDSTGCASSLAVYGACMVIGTALTAVVATSKKKEEND